MNVVRYYLSFCVFLAHLSVLTGIDYPWIQRGTVDVGCFFAISGFLMFPSFQKRPTLKHYITRRALRILPPYFFIILLCAILFFSISTLSCSEYFTNKNFWGYLAANLSFLNFLHPDLPGVFQGSEFHTSAVNGALWTMKGEWVCYLSVPVVFYLLVSKKKATTGIVLALICICSIFARLFLISKADETGSVIYDILSRQFGTLLIFFYIGALINVYFEYFKKYKWWILGIDILILLFSESIPLYDLVLQPLVSGTLVIWFSMIGSWGKWLSKHDSISYDIYLFHFPIIQLAVYLGLPAKLSPMLLLIVVFSATILLASFSWHCIGKFFMKLYKKETKSIPVS